MKTTKLVEIGPLIFKVLTENGVSTVSVNGTDLSHEELADLFVFMKEVSGQETAPVKQSKQTPLLIQRTDIQDRNPIKMTKDGKRVIDGVVIQPLNLQKLGSATFYG